MSLPLNEALQQEAGVAGWTPARAGALGAITDTDERVWMTTAEFEAFRERLQLGRRGRTGLLQSELNIGKGRLKAILDGSPISRLEALACAHFSLGFEMPIRPGEPAAFAAWVAPRFGETKPVCKWLQLRTDHIVDRMVGYDLVNGKKLARVPQADLIRALDWVYRVGPVSPYGERPWVAIWPDQEVVF